jgi:hypothetical protein
MYVLPVDLHLHQLLDIKSEVSSIKVSTVKLMTVSSFHLFVCLSVAYGAKI